MINNNRFKQGKRGLLFLILAASILFNSLAVDAASSPGPQIEFLDDRLSIKVEKVSLGSILEKIHEKVGVEFIVGEAQYEELITVEFQSLHMEEAIKRIMKNFNHSIFFGPNGNIQKVVTLGNSKKLVKINTDDIDKDFIDPEEMIPEPPPLQEEKEFVPPSETMEVESPEGSVMEIFPPSQAIIPESPIQEGRELVPPSGSLKGSGMEISRPSQAIISESSVQKEKKAAGTSGQRAVESSEGTSPSSQSIIPESPVQEEKKTVGSSPSSQSINPESSVQEEIKMVWPSQLMAVESPEGTGTETPRPSKSMILAPPIQGGAALGWPAEQMVD